MQSFETTGDLERFFAESSARHVAKDSFEDFFRSVQVSLILNSHNKILSENRDTLRRLIKEIDTSENTNLVAQNKTWLLNFADMLIVLANSGQLNKRDMSPM